MALRTAVVKPWEDTVAPETALMSSPSKKSAETVFPAIDTFLRGE